MTMEHFVAFYPQFAGFEPAIVAQEYLKQANSRFGDFGADTNEARRLYMAHRLTLYAFTCLPAGSEPSYAIIAAAGKAQSNQQIASKKVGDVQVNYGNSTSSNMTANAASSLADLAETEYGVQLLTLIRQHGFTRYAR